MMESKLAPGFRFHPRDEELINDYLAKKIAGTTTGDDFNSLGMMEDVDLNKIEPWDLPGIQWINYIFNYSINQSIT